MGRGVGCWWWGEELTVRALVPHCRGDWRFHFAWNGPGAFIHGIFFHSPKCQLWITHFMLTLFIGKSHHISGLLTGWAGPRQSCLLTEMKVRPLRASEALTCNSAAFQDSEALVPQGQLYSKHCEICWVWVCVCMHVRTHYSTMEEGENRARKSDRRKI